jgi:hypothetical protein
MICSRGSSRRPVRLGVGSESGSINALRDQVDLLTENMMKLQQALLLTNQKLAEFERRQSPIIGIPRAN